MCASGLVLESHRAGERMTAHTPLLRSLRRLVFEHRLARARGLPVEALPELRAREQARRRLPRRAFLAGAGAGALGLALPPRARAAGAPRVAIVGAGIAGLSCALALADRGVAATVHEASERVGGRMFSNVGYFDDGQVSEWCGELIDSDNDTLHALARRFGLTMDDLDLGGPASAEETYFFDGSYYPKAQADADFAPVYDALVADLAASAEADGARALDAMSVHQWIEGRVPGGHRSLLGRLLDVAYVIEHGAETTDQSTLDLVCYLGRQPVMEGPGFEMFGESDERYHVRGGNQQIPEAIARALGDAVAFGHRLIRIEATPGGRTALTFARRYGTIEVVADLVVLALPFAVLADVDFRRAGFDARKAQAIRRLGRARSGKTQLQFGERVWARPGPWPGVSSGTSYSDAGYQSTWEASRAQPGRSGILVFYSGGSVAEHMATTAAFATLATPGVRDDAEVALRRGERVFPGLDAAWNGRATQSLPHLSDLRGASYSYRRVGQYTAFGGYEAARQGGVLFCGEHTSLTHPAHMEGAAREGERAARDILALLSLRSPEEHP
jgi:monoamine oxidase